MMRSEQFSLHFDNPGIWLDAAYLHPMPREAQEAVGRYLDDRTIIARTSEAIVRQQRVLAQFAEIAGVRADELAFVPGATSAEQRVLSTLDIANRGRVVTDDLHFPGSLAMYERLRSRGVDVVILRSIDGVVRPEQIAEALEEKPTDLLAVSWVSAINGFVHDLQQIADIAHARGALVYADIIQGVGTTELNLAATGIDFAGTSTYKWLMGEIGLGFLYAAQWTWARIADRTHPKAYTTGLFNARLLFEMGSISNIVISALDITLPAIASLPGRCTQGLRLPLYRHLAEELARLGLHPLAPPAAGPICAVTVDRVDELTQRLSGASIYATSRNDTLRIAPSVFNTHADIDAICAVLREHRGPRG